MTMQVLDIQPAALVRCFWDGAEGGTELTQFVPSEFVKMGWKAAKRSDPRVRLMLVALGCSSEGQPNMVAL
jgi:hypothetical protein